MLLESGRSKWHSTCPLCQRPVGRAIRYGGHHSRHVLDAQAERTLDALSFITLLGTPRELRAQHIEVDARLLSTLLWIELGVQ